MSLNINRVTIAGNLTRDPICTQAGASTVAKFGLAINRRFKRGDETVEEVTFLDVEAWGRTAELVGQYLNKGSGCFVEGRLKLDQWDDKKTGEKRTKIMVIAESVQFLGQKPRDGERAQDAPTAPRAVSRPMVPSGNFNEEPPF